MKLSRKQRKLKKSGIRAKRRRSLENKRELIIELERKRWKTSSSVSNFMIDSGGNPTRLINRKGSVPSSETEMFGCEIDKSVPQHIKDYAETLNLGEFIRVPIRKKGLTGSGESFNCHHNSSAITKCKGGQWLRGYTVLQTGERDSSVNVKFDAIEFLYHSVWITPEGNAVCVSNNYFGEFKDLDHILFIPVGLGCIEEFGLDISSFVMMHPQSSHYSHQFFIHEKEVSHNTDMLNVPIEGIDLMLEMSKVGQGVIMKDKDTKENEEYNKTACIEFISGGNFTKKSLATGKSWTELKRDVGMDKIAA